VEPLLSTLLPWSPPGILRFNLFFDVATPSNNVLKELHFLGYMKLRKDWCTRTLVALGKQRRVAPLEFSFLVVHRASAGAGLDWDNAYGGLKPMLDCLVMPSTKNPNGLGVIRDDNPLNMPYPPLVLQGTAKKGAGHTRVEIYELATPAP
jgi:hypothetical protein